MKNALAVGVPQGVATTIEIITPTAHWAVAQGNVERENNATPITMEHRFRIASTSKTFVAVVALQLAEEGVFDLDDLAVQWLPADIVENIANADKVTIRHLLQMRSGVPEYLNQTFLDAVAQNPHHPAYTPAEVLRYAYGKAATSEPGTTFLYTNSNYVLLQLVLENATGQPLHTLLRSRILDPLGMENTYTQLHEELEGGFVHGYSGYKQDGSSVDVTTYNDGAGLGDGALVSNSGDLVTFYRALFHDKTLLSADALAQMLDFQPTEAPDSGYGLGISQFPTPWGVFYGHTGGVYGYGTVAAYHPEKEIFLVSLVATDQANGLIAIFGSLQAALGMP
jgi:D-alanyl-D-alanine carboxypeptidase